MSRPDIEFQFPKLVEVFGLRSVIMANIHNHDKLRFLESLLCLVQEHIDSAFSYFDKSSEPELF